MASERDAIPADELLFKPVCVALRGSDGQVIQRDFRLYGPRAKREYAAQFNETDLQFATRLMEEEGWL